MKKNLFLLVLFVAFIAPQITKAQIIPNGVNFGQTTTLTQGIGIGNFSSFGVFNTSARLHVNNFYCNAPTGGLNGLLFRTDGADNVDNLWQMFTGTGNGVTEKGRIFTSNNFPSMNVDFNIKATAGSMFLYSVNTNGNGFHVMIDSVTDYVGIGSLFTDGSRARGTYPIMPLHIYGDDMNPVVEGWSPGIYLDNFSVIAWSNYDYFGNTALSKSFVFYIRTQIISSRFILFPQPLLRTLNKNAYETKIVYSVKKIIV